MTTRGGVRRPADAGSGAWRHGNLHVYRYQRPALTPITAERKATCKSRWGFTAPSLCSRQRSDRLSRQRHGLSTANVQVEQPIRGETDFRLAHAAYDHPKTCYDREYLFQWAEMDPSIHTQALAQVTAKEGCTAGAPGCSLEVPTEPYHPAYFLINGRSMPDLMDANYAAEYPHQPYNGNPHMHPGELILVRAIGQGRWQHPFHEHGNHVRILGARREPDSQRQRIRR